MTGTSFSLGAEPCPLSELRETSLSPVLCCLSSADSPFLCFYISESRMWYCIVSLSLHPRPFSWITSWGIDLHTVWLSFPKPPCPSLPQECNAIMSSPSDMDSSVLPAELCPTHLTISKIENPNLNIWFNFPHCPLLGRDGNGAQSSPSTTYRFLSFLPGGELRQPGKAALDGTVTTDLMSPRTMHLPVTDRKT